MKVKAIHHHHHHHVACPELDVAVRTSLLHACRFCVDSSKPFRTNIYTLKVYQQQNMQHKAAICY